MQQVSPNQETFIDSMSTALLEMKMLDKAAVDRARRAYGETKAGFDTVLTELGLLSDEELASFWSKWLQIPLLSDMELPETPILEDLLDQKFLAANSVVPVCLENDELWVAMSDPLDRSAISAIEYLLDAEIRTVAATRKQIAALLKQLYESGVSVQSDGRAQSLDASVNDSDVEHLKALASEGPTIQRVNSILSAALERNASDVHLEPDQYGLLVRFRIDGYLQEVEKIDPGSRAAVISRVKIMARMDITERRVPQDGRVSVTIRGRNVDLRISTLPTVHGESTVIRLLRREEANLNWDNLGFSADIQAKLGDVLSDPNGIFLVTGPTGSGKTTTLYTALRQLNAREQKLVSRSRIPSSTSCRGSTRCRSSPRSASIFANALRSILRQDPDIIMIGEIRDLETAEIAIRASLTGHLVLSTLHTNSAAAAITRLIEMGTAPYLVAACVRAVLSQRLVRTLCTDCSEPLDEASVPQAMRATGQAHGGESSGYRRPVGCETCRGTGYSGRTVISELLMIDDPVKANILAGAGEDEITRTAVKSGMAQLIDHGLDVASRGRTSLEEVISIAGRRG